VIGRKKRTRHPNDQQLETIAEAFREIEAYFELLGFSRNPGEESSEEQQENGEEDRGEDWVFDHDADHGPGVYQREEIEVAIDVFISELVREDLLPKPSLGKEPSLQDVFERLFDDDHKIVELAKQFDEHIEGYFGAISYDDMNSAHWAVLGIHDILTKRKPSQ
jgi:hypothetical protein